MTEEQQEHVGALVARFNVTAKEREDLVERVRRIDEGNDQRAGLVQQVKRLDAQPRIDDLSLGQVGLDHGGEDAGHDQLADATAARD